MAKVFMRLPYGNISAVHRAVLGNLWMHLAGFLAWLSLGTRVHCLFPDDSALHGNALDIQARPAVMTIRRRELALISTLL